MQGSTLFAYFILYVCPVRSETHTFDRNVLSFTVGVNKIFVLTSDRLHQLTLNLNLESFKEISNASCSNMVMILVPFISNGTLLTCGSFSCGYCEVLDLYNISRSLHWESINIGAYRNVAFITDNGREKYLLVSTNTENSECDSDTTVLLRNTLGAQPGGIFSKVSTFGYAGIQALENREIKLVDGFQLNFAPQIYLFMNVKIGSSKRNFETEVKMITFESKDRKDETFETLRGAVLLCCGENRMWVLLSSAVIPGNSTVLWAGVFQENKTNAAGDSAVAIFDIRPSRAAPVSGFCVNSCSQTESRSVTDVILKPATVVFRYSSLTSVAAIKSNSWIVLFVGTETGLLIKLLLDEALKPGCPTVLSSSDDRQPMLPKLLFDPVDLRHVFIASGNQIKRVPVAQCGVYVTLTDCWSALDPFCGWCLSQIKCTFQHDCSSSDWVSVPGTAQQRDIISVHMIRNYTGQSITVEAAPNLNRGISVSCALEKCDSPGPSNCSCTFPSESFPAEGLSLRVRITVQRDTITKEVHFKNCSSIRGLPTSTLCIECFSAGCVWSLSGDACTWRTSSSKYANTTKDICKKYTSAQNNMKPEILSLVPDRVPLHGVSYAVITGRNLKSVTNILFQGLDCNPKVSPVLFHSDNSSYVEFLTFHIPNGSKGYVRVCLLTPDSQCHGNAKLTYFSPNVPLNLLQEHWFQVLLPHCFKLLVIIAITCYLLKTKPNTTAIEDIAVHYTRDVSCPVPE